MSGFCWINLTRTEPERHLDIMSCATTKVLPRLPWILRVAMRNLSEARHCLRNWLWRKAAAGALLLRIERVLWAPAEHPDNQVIVSSVCQFAAEIVR